MYLLHLSCTLRQIIVQMPFISPCSFALLLFTFFLTNSDWQLGLDLVVGRGQYSQWQHSGSFQDVGSAPALMDL